MFKPILVKCTLSTLIVLAFVFISSAQIDKQFWFVAPEVSSTHADRPIFFKIQSYDQPVNVTIKQPANNSLAPKTVSLQANSIVSVNMTDWIDAIENKPANTVLSKGIYIESTDYISVYYEVYGTNSFAPGTNSDIFTLKGRNALGTNFILPFQTVWDNQITVNATSGFDIVASENQTIIEITPTRSIVGHSGFTPFTITLNKGQTWSGRSISALAFGHPSGSKITSNKPIAVTLFDDSMVRDVNYDLGGDQLIPVSKLGLEYIVIQPYNPIVGDSTNMVTIAGTENNTYIDVIQGTISNTYLLHSMQSVTLDIQQTAYIKADHPIAVLQTASYGNELGQCILPTIQCTGSKRIGFFRSNEEPFQLALLTKKGNENSFLINGQPFTQMSSFSEVEGNIDWVFAIKTFTTSEIQVNTPYIVSNPNGYFHLATYNGYTNTGFRFGYFSDFGFVDLGRDSVICKGSSITLDGGIDKDSYLWEPNMETGPQIVVSDTGTYKVTIQKDVCVFTDSVKIGWPSFTNDIISADLDSVCMNDTLIIHTLQPFSSYLWNNGKTQDSLLLIGSNTPLTKWSIIAKDSFNCSYYDTITIKSISLPEGIISTIPQELKDFCTTIQVALELQTTADTWQWYTGETTSTIQVNRNAKDLYFVQLKNSVTGCTNRINYQPDCSVFIEVPNLITPNNDGKNDIFEVKYLPLDIFELEVYNSWGSRIHYQSVFNNDWETSGKLPSGVYYVILTQKYTHYTYKGWLHVTP
ncbi:MAG: gliding motility-associated C-terminal domain-containing protein [Cytophagaceae bacterium]